MAFQPPFPGAPGGFPGAYPPQQQGFPQGPAKPPGPGPMNGFPGQPGAPNGAPNGYPQQSNGYNLSAGGPPAPQQYNNGYQGQQNQGAPAPPTQPQAHPGGFPGGPPVAPSATPQPQQAYPGAAPQQHAPPTSAPSQPGYPSAQPQPPQGGPTGAPQQGQGFQNAPTPTPQQSFTPQPTAQQQQPQQQPQYPGQAPGPTPPAPQQAPAYPGQLPGQKPGPPIPGPGGPGGFQQGPPGGAPGGFQQGPPVPGPPGGAPGGFQQGPPVPGPPGGAPGGFQQGPPVPGPPGGPGGFQQGPPTMPGQQRGPGPVPGQQPGGFPQPMPGPPGMMPQGPPGQPQHPGMPGGHPGMPSMPGPPGMPGQQPGPYPAGPQGFQQQGPPGQPGFPPGPGGFQGGPPQMGGPGGFPGGPGGAPGAPVGFPGGPLGGPGPYPGPGGQQQRQRLDPNMMPSAVQVRDDDAVRAGPFPTGFPHAEHPPLVSTDFFAQDQGNCNPRLMRSTIYIAPQTQDMLKHSQIPFAVAVSPFAELHAQERAPPIIDLGPQGPIRCQRCKAYMNPFMEFQDGGRRFRCLFCHASTPVEDAYFAHLDHTGRRTDIDYRPELQFGAYEFVATKQYCKNGVAPKEPAFIFMLDVSYNALQNGMLQTLCTNLETILAHLPREQGQPESAIRIGLAAFDSVIHFFDLSSPTPNTMVVGDVSDVFVPCVDGLLLPYNEALPAIRAILAEIPRLFGESMVTETILGPVVQAGLDALKCSDRSGKLFVFATSLPVLEAPGKLKNRDDRKLLGTEKEKSILTPQTEFYTKLGEQCVKSGCTVDLFLFPNAFIDVATLGQLTAVTGGSLYKYQYFDAAKDSVRFLTDLHHDVSRQIAFDCMVRLRSSAGIRPVKFHGSFFMENTTDMEISSIDQDKAFFVELKHDDKLSDPLAVIQAAVLFTSVSGQRRLRIINLCLPVSADYNQLYRVADQDSLSAYLLKLGVEMNREKGQKEVREYLTNRVAHMLAAYREKCSEQAPLGQLILPETLKIIPCFVNSILKNDAIAGGSEMTVDDKAWMVELVRGLKVEESMQLLYPRVFPVTQLEINEPSELTTLPQLMRASSEYLKHEEAYLIDNGICLFLWIGLGVAEKWVQDVFGANAVTLIDTENHVIPEKDNAKSRALRRCIDLVQQGPRRRKIFVVREKDALEPWMRKFLVEDRAGQSGMTYVDYLCFIHKEIRNILS